VKLAPWQSTVCIPNKTPGTQLSKPALGMCKTLPFHHPAQLAFLETPLAALLRTP
jgi:hypothetical protein